jgi:2Fe-2S ferredoxin
VSAVEKTTGVSARIEVKPSYGLGEDEMARMLRESMEHAREDMERRLLIEARVEAERVLLALAAALAKDGALATPEERATLASLAERIRAAIPGADRDLINGLVERLEETGRPFAQRRIDRALHGALAGHRLDEIEADMAPEAGPAATDDAAPPRDRVPAGTRPARRRSFSTMPKMTFIKTDGTRVEVEAPVGLSVLEIAHRNDIDLEGACEGSLACSTCHVIVDPEWYEVLKEATEDEEDMLDLAFGLTHTSRLGCQIKMTEELDGLTVRLPAGTRNMMLE